MSQKGDYVCCSASDPSISARIDAILITDLNDFKNIVSLSPNCQLTRGHPVRKKVEGTWCRADQMGLAPESIWVDRLFNFELQRPHHSVVVDGDFECGTVGKSFPEMNTSKENDMLWGDSYWTTTRLRLKAGQDNNVTYMDT